MKTTPEKVNFLIFVTDQQRADHLGCAGHPILKTPNIDKIAEKGVMFTNCYTSCPACSPARATLFTGLTNRGHGMRMNGISLPAEVPTLMEVLAKADYRTHSIGKLHLMATGNPTGVDIENSETPIENSERHIHWHNGRIKKSPNNYYGFQTQDSVIGHGDYVCGDYDVWLNENYPGEREKYYSNDAHMNEQNWWQNQINYPCWDLRVNPELHYNKWIADKAIDFFQEEKNSTSPFFLWCSFPDPHAPFAAVKPWADFYKNADIEIPKNGQEVELSTIPDTVIKTSGGADNFIKKAIFNGTDNLKAIYKETFGMISHVDEQIGRIMKSLQEAGLDKNTVVIFLADHGDQLGEHGLMHKNFWPYDGCNKVPFIANVPWSRNKGIIVDDVISLLDFMPTVLEFANVSQPDDQEVNKEYLAQVAPLSSPLPGESLKSAILGEAEPKRKNALIEFDDDLNKAFDLTQMRMIVTNEYKLCFYSPAKEGVLFDRKNDPEEENNLFYEPEYKEIVNKLFVELMHEVSRTDSRLPRRMAGA
ncbi:MAG: sulfatase-like hydrolase/transferase [Victivallaceae bacterium]|nr:sulfatase-like hydrolase/transferase [Victivallaceae bacterium]